MGVTLTITNPGRLQLVVEQKFGVLPQKMRKALRSVGEVWMTEAKERTPVDTGTLRASGIVVQLDPDTVRLSFGGPAAGYALIVHENLAARHEMGQAKYLESAVLEHRGTFGKELEAFL